MKTYAYTNPEHTQIRVEDTETGEVLHVPADPANRHYREIVELNPIIRAFVPPPPPPPPPRTFSKKRLFESMTDAEYDTWEQVEAQQSKRKVRMLREAVELNEADPSFAELRAVMANVYGEARTVALLDAAALG